jgi:hypothetical protein
MARLNMLKIPFPWGTRTHEGALREIFPPSFNCGVLCSHTCSERTNSMRTEWRSLAASSRSCRR